MTTMSSAVDPWWEFDQTQHGLRHNTLDRLKSIINGLNAECGANLPKSGRKQEILDRIQETLYSYKSSNDVNRWQKARVVIHQVRSSGTYTPQRITTTGFHAASTNGAYASAKPTKAQPMTPTTPIISHPYSSVPRASTSAIPPISARAVLAFKSSPFFRVEQAVSVVAECPESHTPADRRTGSVSFTLTPEQCAKLYAPGSTYQLRLYCTSSTYHVPYRNNQELCPIEFPPTCEVRVNNTPLNANLKGLKKKPGTAPPANLGATVRRDQTNRVEMVYVNSAQGVPPKKYYIVVQLVEVTTVDQLVDRLRKGKYRDGAIIAQEMRAQAINDDDDDIVAGPQKMSLRDSLTLCRVATPCRSSRCVHPQCFDAGTWFSMMEQTTTWLCPVCEKALNTEELIVDGYFEAILKATSDEVEDVIVEADGEWHTSDNKFASPAWKALNPPIPSPAMRSETPKPIKKEGPKLDEILVLDSDEEDEEGQVKRQLSPTFRNNRASVNSSFNGTLPPPSASSTPTRNNASIIDLTLSDSEDETPVVVQRSALPPPVPPLTLPSASAQAAMSVRSDKRKAPDEHSPTESVWKKSRSDYPPPAANGASHISTSRSSIPPGAAYSNGQSYTGMAQRDVSHLPPRPPVDERYSRYRSPPRQDGAAYGVYNYPPPHAPQHSHSRNVPSGGYRNGYPYTSSSHADTSSNSSGRW